MSKIWKNLSLMVFALSATAAFAQDALLKPFVLASKGAGDVAQAVEASKAALTKAGFTSWPVAIRPMRTPPLSA